MVQLHLVARSHVRTLCLLACSVLILSIGCGKPTVPTGTVQGKVTMNDEPYAGDASVNFMSSETGQASSGNVQSDGTFQLKTPLPVGSYVVFLGPRGSDSPDGTMQPEDEKFDSTLPAKYRSESTTDIKFDVVEGKNDFTVALKK